MSRPLTTRSSRTHGRDSHSCARAAAQSVRQQAIVRLLETRDLNLPESSPQSNVASGFVHKARSRSCPDCLANGRISPACQTCFGRGQVDPRYARLAATDALPDDDDRRDPYAVNEKTKRYGLDGSRHDQAYARDRQIEVMGRQTRPARSEAALLEEANREPYGWERAREQMLKRFDYAVLDQALEQLRQHDDVAYRALHAVFVYGWLRDVSGAAELAIERGLAFLSPRLAAVELARGKKLRAPGVTPEAVNVGARGRGADPRALMQRNDAVLAALAEGASTADVAERFNLSISQVNRVARGGARRAEEAA